MINIPNNNQEFRDTFVTQTMIPSSSVKKESDLLITFLFNETIVKLTTQLKSLPLMTQDQCEAASEKIIQESCFYSLLKGINAHQVPLEMQILHSMILKINESQVQVSDDEIKQDKASVGNEEIIFGTILACFRFLSRNQDWKSTDTTVFFEKLYHSHAQQYGNKGVTRVLELIDKGLAVGCLSPNSQAFMDKLTYSEQFDPIKDYLMKVDGDVTGETTGSDIARIADKFFTKAVKISYLIMSRNIYNFPIIQHAIPLIGMSEFRETIICAKYIYLMELRDSYLSYVAKAKQKLLPAESAIKVIEKKVIFSKQLCTLSFVVAYEEEKTIIKAITVSCDYLLESTQPTDRNNDLETVDQDVYFFVQELTEETPQLPPDPAIPLCERPLYKFELIPNSHYIRLQRASGEVRKLIIHLIGEIEQELIEGTQNKGVFECNVRTAIWHQEELMLVEIIGQIGSMLTSRALYGAIKTYVKKLPQPAEGPLSEPLYFKDFQNQLERILIAAYVLVTNEYLSSWHQDSLLKPMFEESCFIQETKGMKIIKERTLEVFNKHAQPGKWLLKSMMTCGYDGNPAMLAPLTNAPVDALNKTLQFEECKALLQAALEIKIGQTEEEHAIVISSLVDAMVKGMLAIMRRSKGKKIIVADLKQRFQSVKEFPLHKIPNIMQATEPSRQKASRLIYHLLFSRKSLSLDATKEQRRMVMTYLNLKKK